MALLLLFMGRVLSDAKRTKYKPPTMWRLLILMANRANSLQSKQSVSEFMGYLKGKSVLMIFDKPPELGSKRDRTFWVRGYYVCTVGNTTE